jgi:hypothetical protein
LKMISFFGDSALQLIEFMHVHTNFIFWE